MSRAKTGPGDDGYARRLRVTVSFLGPPMRGHTNVSTLCVGMGVRSVTARCSIDLSFDWSRCAWKPWRMLPYSFPRTDEALCRPHTTSFGPQKTRAPNDLNNTDWQHRAVLQTRALACVHGHAAVGVTVLPLARAQPGVRQEGGHNACTWAGDMHKPGALLDLPAIVDNLCPHCAQTANSAQRKTV